MFEKSLQDLVKGIRANKQDPKPFISQAIAECKMELRNVDPYIKAQAVRKLTYLQMMGYDVSWAAFAIVETMSQARFAHKRIGYLAACQCFSESTDVVLLTTNLLKKEFQSTSQYEVGLAVNCLANIVTRDLARDLLQDTVLLMSHSKPYVRKKSVSALYKLFEKYPQGLRLTFDKLKERLADGEPAVTSCAVNVVCELANQNPNNYLSMAPQFFRLLTTSSNNWMLIKVVKLMGSLVPQEPRLARKLLEPLAAIIQNTAAKSLQYECIHTLTLALPFTKKADGTESRNVPGVVQLCSDNLRQFVDDQDQNLKYLGLVGLVELMKSHPKAVVEHKERVLLCLSDDDVTIRTRALELLTGMVTRKNLEELVAKLLKHVATAEGSYRDELISRVVYMCSRDKYSYLSDFSWYLSVLVKLAHLRGSKHGALVAEQLVDVAMRVKPVRRYAARDMVVLLLDDRITVGQGLDTIADVLSAAAWIAGEYCSYLFEEGDDDDDEDDDDEEEEDEEPRTRQQIPNTRLREKLVDILTHPRVTNLPASVQNVYLQNALKVVALSCERDEDDELEATLELAARRIDVFTQSVHVEVQERAQSFLGLLEALGALEKRVEYSEKERSISSPTKDADDADENLVVAAAFSKMQPTYVTYVPAVAKGRLAAVSLAALSVEKMVPVNPKAQQRVPVPEGLDLSAPIATQAVLENFFSRESENLVDGLVPKGANGEDALSRVRFVESGPRFHGYVDEDADDEFEEDFEERDAASSPRPQQVAALAAKQHHPMTDDPFYLRETSVDPNEVDVDDVPMLRLTAKDLARPSGKKKKKQKKRRVNKGDVDTSELMPDGAVESDTEKNVKSSKRKKPREPAIDQFDDALTDLAAVDITTPLRDDEVMPTIEHRANSTTSVVRKGQGGLLVNETIIVDPTPPAAAPAPPPAPIPEKKKTKKKSSAAKSVEKTIKKKKKTGSKAVQLEPAPHQQEKPQAQQQYGDLLDLLDFGPPPSAPSSHPITAPTTTPTASAPVDAFDGFQDLLLSTSQPSPPPAPPVQSSDSTVFEEDGKMFLPLFSQGSLTGQYHVFSQTGTCRVEIRCANTSKTDLYSSLSFFVGEKREVPIASSLGAFSSARASFDLADGTPGASVDCSVSFCVEGLVPEPARLNVRLKLPAGAFLCQARVSPAAFAQLLGSNNATRPWVSVSVKVSSWTSKDPVSDVAGYLNAHIVERLDASASMLAAVATDLETKAALLVKPLLKSNKLKVDIKSTDRALADAIAADLAQLSELKKQQPSGEESKSYATSTASISTPTSLL